MILRPGPATAAAPKATAAAAPTTGAATLPLSPSSLRRRRPRRSPPAASSAPRDDVFALDFDGVLVDSEPEVSSAAVEAAISFDPAWRSAVLGEEAEADEEGGASARRGRRKALLLDALKHTRPVLVRGYEAVVMARLLAEEIDASGRADAAVERILSDWPGRQLEEAMARFFFGGSSSESDEGGEGEATVVAGRAPLEAHFEALRRASLEREPSNFFRLNVPYPTKGDALRAALREEAAGPVYFVSSKKAERVSALLKHHYSLEDVHEASPRLFASLLPPEDEKRRALREIAARPAARGAARLHFVDDRLETLLAVARDTELAPRWTLYLAAWGYCAPGEVEEAERLAAEEAAATVGAGAGGGGGGIRVLRRPEELAELLRWGLVSGGVDDGCEATEEEKRAEGWLEG